MSIIVAISLITLAIALTVIIYNYEAGSFLIFVWVLSFLAFQCGAKWQREEIKQKQQTESKQ